MNLCEIQNHIRQFIFDRYPAARAQRLSDTDSLLDGGIIDSLGVLDLVTFLEARFDLPLSEDDLDPDDFESVESIAQFVHRRLKCTSS